jgi:ABC-type multidrug transport system fused ATPase/permease subunit
MNGDTGTNVISKSFYEFFKECFSLLDRRDKRKVTVIVIVQSFLSLADILGVLLVGVLTASLVGAPMMDLLKPLQFFFTTGRSGNDFNSEQQKSIAVLLILILFLFKTGCSIYFTRRLLYFMSLRGAVFSGKLMKKVWHLPLFEFNKVSSQNLMYAVTSGVESLFIQILATGLTLLSEIILLVCMTGGLIIISPVGSTTLLLLFGIVFFIIYFLLHKRIKALGEANVKLRIDSNTLIIDAIYSYREAFVQNRRNYFYNHFYKLRESSANVLAEISFLPSISKYAIETFVVIGMCILVFLKFLSDNLSISTSTMAILLAGSARMAPTLLRIQQGYLIMQGNIPMAQTALDLKDLTKDVLITQDTAIVPDRVYEGFIPNITVRSLTFRYPGEIRDVFQDISFTLEPGEVALLVGPSGVGKSTLIECLLGLRLPTSGEVEVSNLPPAFSSVRWPGAISYMPQEVTITSGSIRSNVCLGFEEGIFGDHEVTQALEKAGLGNFIDSQHFGINSNVGEDGNLISGGQRQRIGIARALLTKPKLLILDEATNALDDESYYSILETIKDISVDTTVILISHQREGMKISNVIIEMSENGTIKVSR